MGFEAQDREDNERRVDCREGVAGSDQDHVSHHVVLGRVVGAKGDQRPEGKAEGVEHLGGRLAPNCRVQELLDLGGSEYPMPNQFGDLSNTERLSESEYI